MGSKAKNGAQRVYVLHMSVVGMATGASWGVSASCASGADVLVWISKRPLTVRVTGNDGTYQKVQELSGSTRIREG